MSKPLFALLVLMAVLITIGGCLRFRISSPPVSKTSTSRDDQGGFPSPTPIENYSLQEAKAAITINTVSFHGWWWSDEQFANNFDADNPPPKASYIKLDQWDASQPDSAHPDRIDVTCRVENRTNQPVALSLVAVADFKVASYRFMTEGPNSDKSIDESLKGIPWTESHGLGRIELGKLAAGEAREIQFKDFFVRSIVDKYLKPAARDLWPWKLRVSIIAKSSEGVHVAHAEATINLLPAD